MGGRGPPYLRLRPCREGGGTREARASGWTKVDASCPAWRPARGPGVTPEEATAQGREPLSFFPGMRGEYWDRGASGGLSWGLRQLSPWLLLLLSGPQVAAAAQPKGARVGQMTPGWGSQGTEQERGGDSRERREGRPSGLGAGERGQRRPGPHQWPLGFSHVTPSPLTLPHQRGQAGEGRTTPAAPEALRPLRPLR